MWEEAVNECGCACVKCVGSQLRFLSEWQKLNKALEDGSRVVLKSKQWASFFPDGHDKTEWLHRYESLQVIWRRTGIYFQKTKLATWSVGFVTRLGAAGHSSLSVFAKVTNRKEKKIPVETIRTEAWQGKSKYLFCDSFWFPTAASVNLCSNLRVSAIHPKLNCCLFYSVVVKAAAGCWMLSRGNEGPWMLNTAADTTLFLKDPPLDLPKQNVTVIVKIYINGKELTRSHGYQIWQT